MLPFTTLLLRVSLAPLEFARAYCEAFASAAPNVAPKLNSSNGAALTAATGISSGNRGVPSDRTRNSAMAMNTQFYENQVATVEYQILFTKRDSEALLEHKTTTVAKAMTGNGFASWKIAQFVLDKDGFEKPAEWKAPDLTTFANQVGTTSKYKLKDEYVEFLQVDYQIISTFDRKPSTDQVTVLRDIAAAIRNKP